MSLKFSPAITYPNTRYYIDLGNRRCYREGINNTFTGSPTTVFDLSPLKLTGQVYNGRYTDAFGGAVYFAGGLPSQSYFLGSLNSLIPFVSGLSAFTLSFWYNANNVKETQVLHKFGGTTDGGIIVFLEDNYINIELYCFRNNLYTGLKQRFFTTANEWHNFTFNWYIDAPYLVSFHDGDTSENLTTLILNNTASTVPLSTFKYNGEILDPNTFTLKTSSLTYIPRFCIWAGSGYLRQNLISSPFVLSLTGYLNSILYTSNYTFTKEDVKDFYESNRSRYAVNYNNQIVKNGLICHLDAGDPNSYTGTNLLNDISYNENDATLINGPSAANINGGIIRLDGVDEKISITTNTIRLPSKQPFTRMFWVKYNNVNNTGYDDINLLSDDLYLGSKLKYNTNTKTLCSVYAFIESIGDLYGIQTNVFAESLSATYLANLTKVSRQNFNNISSPFDIYEGTSTIYLQNNNKLSAVGLDYGNFGPVVSAGILPHPYDYNFRVFDKPVELNLSGIDLDKVAGFTAYSTVIRDKSGRFYITGFANPLIESFTKIFDGFYPVTDNTNLPGNFVDIKMVTENTVYALSSTAFGTNVFTGGFVDSVFNFNNSSQLGTSNGIWGSYENLRIPFIQNVGIPNTRYNISKIFPGPLVGFILSANGRAFASGECRYMGKGTTGTTTFTAIEGNWDRFETAPFHTFALSANTNIWFGCGENDIGQLGLGDENNRYDSFERIPGEFKEMYPLNSVTTVALSTSDVWYYAGIEPGSSNEDFNYGPGVMTNWKQSSTFKEIKNSKGIKKFACPMMRWWNIYSLPKITRNNNLPIVALKTNDYNYDITTLKVNELSSWNLIVQSYDPNGYSKLYVIGKEKNHVIEFPLTDLVFSNNTNNLTFGQEGVSLDIGPIMMYNRELSHNEIIQNFNATKDRFLEPTSLIEETQNNYILIAQLI